MKNKFKYGLITLFVLPMMSFAASTINGEVDGGVGGVATNNFVPNASVTLINGSGNSAVVIASTTTDANGQYSFTNVPTGFTQVSVSADGYTPNPSTAVYAINSDTTITSNFVLTTTGSQDISGTSSIGGQVTGSGTLSGAQVTLRRRGTAAGAWVIVDSTLTDSYGSFLFSNIASAGSTYDINAYSLIANVSGYNSFTSGAITVGDGATAVSNIALTVTAIALTSVDKTQSIRFSMEGSQLSLDLGVSNLARTLVIYGLNGVQKNISIPVNTSHVLLPAAFAPEKGFLFRIN